MVAVYDLKSLPRLTSGVTTATDIFGALSGQSDAAPDPISADAFDTYFSQTTKTLTNKTLTAPDINGGTADALTSLGIRSTGAAFDILLASAEVITANRTLSLVLGNAARSITFSGNPTLGDWFDQSVKAAASPQFAGLEVGHATDSTLGRTSAGLLNVEGVDLVTVSATQTLTNKSLTSPIINTGLELGHATDTTLTRVSAGKVAVEGNELAQYPTLAATTTGNGASLIGIEDSGSYFSATTVEGALAYVGAAVAALDQAVILKGTWDASAGTFPGAGAAQSGWSYIVSVGGTVDSVAFTAGDRIIAILDNASTTVYATNWFKADYTDQVSSVAGRTGAVTLAQADISGLTTADSPQLAAINLGHASDTTITRVSAGVIAVEGSNVLLASNLGTNVAAFLATPSSANLAAAVTDETGSGALVFGTSPVLTTPRFANAGFLADANGNELIIFTTTASAVNELTFANAATGGSPTLAATGGDANIHFDFQAKGTGAYRLLGTASQAAELRLYEDTDAGTNYTAFKVGTQAADITYTLPTALGAAGTFLRDLAGNGVLSWDSVAGAGTVTSVAVSNNLYSGGAAITASGTVYIEQMIPGGRLTLTSGTPVTTADVTAAQNVYYAPYKHRFIPVYNGTNMQLYNFTASATDAVGLTLALAASANWATATGYDVFYAYVSGSLYFGTGPAWTSGTARGTGAGTTELQLYNGLWTNAVSMTLRTDAASTQTVPANQGTYLGSFYTTGSGQTEDSVTSRYLWNCYNRSLRAMRRLESTDTWTYTTASYRQANASTANQLQVFRGLDEDAMTVVVQGAASNNISVGLPVSVGIGLDSTTVNATGVINGVYQTLVANLTAPTVANLTTYPGLGRHYLAWLEYSGASNTTTWYGDAGFPTVQQCGIFAQIFA